MRVLLSLLIVITSVTTLLSSFTVSSATQVQETSTVTAHEHSYVGYHGMYVFFSPDKTKLYAHHLPLYREPHDYQIVYEIEMGDKVSALKGLPFITLLPEKFDLMRLINNQSISLDVTFYDGHFERGGEVFSKQKVAFKHAIYTRKITASEQADLGSFDVVETTEHYLAIHRIEKQPGFDALAWLSDDSPHYRTLKCEINETESPDKLNETVSDCLNSPVEYIETRDFAWPVAN